MSTYETIELVDAVEGDEVYQGGRWTPVERVTVFGSRNDLVKVTFAGGGTSSGPLRNMGKARRLVVEVDECASAPTIEASADNPPCVYCGRHHVDRALVLVSRLHGADIAAYLYDAHPSALPLVANGWTTDAALAHVDGVCDRAICGGAHGGPLGEGCPHADRECSPAYLCGGCVDDLLAVAREAYPELDGEARA